MEALEFLFVFGMIALAAWLTYAVGIKPERESRKRRSEHLRAYLREAARNAHSSRRAR